MELIPSEGSNQACRCCQCGNPQTTNSEKRLSNCWFHEWGEPPCPHYFCEDHGSHGMGKRLDFTTSVMEVMQTLGLKILNLHESTQFKGSEEAANSLVPDVAEKQDEPEELSVEDGQFYPDNDPILMQIYANDAQSRAEREQSLEHTIAKMEEEHKAFHEILESNLVTKYVKEASDRLAVLMKLNGTVPEVNLLARVPMEDDDAAKARPNAQVKVRRTTRRQQRRLAESKSKTKRTLQAEYFADLRVLEQMIQQVKAEST
eukprot:6353457-Amphidinium_carterae.1